MRVLCRCRTSAARPYIPPPIARNNKINRMVSVPRCWGHRGASSDYPENTLASFESAARAGADGIESDVHVTSDNYILMFHDPKLGRTTIGGSGSIKDQPYVGNIEHLRTAKKPEQKIPTFAETVEWLNRFENQHMQFNIDVKADNDPERLFTLMRAALAAHENWEITIAPRLILGFAHPKFVPHAITILPNIKRCFIGIDLKLAQYPIFWDACDAFSIAFPILATAEGERFRQRCNREGKNIFAFMCNRQEEWAMAAAWGLDVVMTDTPTRYIAEFKAANESKRPMVPRDTWFMWKSLLYYSVLQWIARYWIRRRLERLGGPFSPTSIFREET